MKQFAFLTSSNDKLDPKARMLMEALINGAVEANANAFTNMGAIYPGDEELNEKFDNLKILRGLEKKKEIKLLHLPTNAEMNKADIMKHVFNLLYNKQAHGVALNQLTIQKSVGDLISELQEAINQTQDINLANKLCGLELADMDLRKKYNMSLFSQPDNVLSRLTPTVIKVEAKNFIRETYPGDSLVINDTGDIEKIIAQFQSKFSLGVPTSSLESIFMDILADYMK